MSRKSHSIAVSVLNSGQINLSYAFTKNLPSQQGIQTKEAQEVWADKQLVHKLLPHWVSLHLQLILQKQSIQNKIFFKN